MTKQFYEPAAELRLVAQAEAQADPRYVLDVTDFLWSSRINRKLQRQDSLAPLEKQRLHTLTELCS